MDEWIIDVKRIFVENSFSNGEGHGGNDIRFPKKYERFVDFFDLEVDARYLSQHSYSEMKNFILLKDDLDNYIAEVKFKFHDPQKEEIYPEVNNREFQVIKEQLVKEFEELEDYYETIRKTFFEFQMSAKKYGTETLCLGPEDVNAKYFRLLKKISIPGYTFFSIMKVRKNQKVYYYFRVTSKNIKTFERLYPDSKDLVIDPDTEKQLWASLDAGQNIILTGVPGTGKTHLATVTAKEVMGEEGYVLTTATSDWTTFDTIGGLIPKSDAELVFREGKFLQSIRENKWLIIDEINRADIDKAFGQLFTVLSGQDVELPYYIKDETDEDNLIPIKIKTCDNYDSFYDKSNATYYIGKNWRIIATMNSYDKNALFDLSYAFMRRFMIIEVGVPKNLADFINKLEDEDGNTLYDKLSKGYTDRLENLYAINTEYDEIDRMLGPAIFLDILKYIYHRIGLEGKEYLDNDGEPKKIYEDGKYNYINKIFSEALIAYVIPQFEGLGTTQRSKVKDFLDDVFDGEDSSLVKGKLDDMKSFFG